MDGILKSFNKQFTALLKLLHTFHLEFLHQFLSTIISLSNLNIIFEVEEKKSQIL